MKLNLIVMIVILGRIVFNFFINNTVLLNIQCSVSIFKLQLCLTSFQLIKQPCCLPAGNYDEAVCGSVLNTVQCERREDETNTITRGRVLIYYCFHNWDFKITQCVSCPPCHRDNLTTSPLNQHLILKPSHPSSSTLSWSLVSSPSPILNIQFTEATYRRGASCVGA